VTIEGTILDSSQELRGINIIDAMRINSRLTTADGATQIAARTLYVQEKTDSNGRSLGTFDVKVHGVDDGINAVNISTLFNQDKDNVVSTATVRFAKIDSTTTPSTTTTVVVDMDVRSVGDISLNAYYDAAMSKLGTDARSIDTKESAQDDLITQIVNWRSSTSGVDWNEELTNMIKFQKGYSACSRCLTTMDEMLDRLINSTGTVGR
jgi:flagellar hook-associated protein 1 FlgK